MNSLQPSTTPVIPVRPTFSWIEIFAVPIATCIMETQPIVLFLAFMAFATVSPDTPLPLDEVSVTLILLGLQWWSMFINYRLLHGLNGRTASILHILGVAVAYALALVTNLATLDLPSALVILGLVIFCWKRAVDKARVGLDDEQLILIFKIGLAVSLIVLCMTVLFSTFGTLPLFGLLSYALPLFFLSGLIGLSFTRLGVIRREQARQGGAQIDPTRSWLVALTFLWGITVAGAVALETFSFGTIQALLLPIWEFLGAIVIWIIYLTLLLMVFIFDLLDSLFHFTGASAQMSQRPRGRPMSIAPPTAAHNQAPAWLILSGRIALIMILLALLFFIVRAILRQARPSLEQDSEEEIRESLSVRDILRERQQQHRQQAHKREELAIEALDPNSARAQYRALLQGIAWSDASLGRRSAETPVEYQKRLVALLEKTSSGTPSQEDRPSDRELLENLTRAYAAERYGGRHTEVSQHADLQSWVSRLLITLKK